MSTTRISGIWISVLVLCISPLLLFAQSNKPLKQPKDGFSIAFYNVENLFDTIDDPKTKDQDFLPSAAVSWNTERYFHKIHQIAKVIANMDSLNYPHIVGLAEVENETVLEDLIAHEFISKAGYKIIHEEDTDPRGIEVALLYRPDYFRPLYHKPLVYMRESGYPTRHILYVKGVIHSGDTLHVFVNHWLSRYGGVEKTAGTRNGTANFLRMAVDMIFSMSPQAKIIIGGDFNDNPDDPSMFSFLRALAPDEEPKPNELYNLAMIPYLEGQGTSYYNKWDFFDQIIVSSSLIQSDSPLYAGPINVIKKDWMLYNAGQYNARPNRTMTRRNYFGGFSDHLPVMVKLYRKDQLKK